MYSSVQDVVDQSDPQIIIQLTADDDTGAYDTALIEAKIREADSIIDGYLRKTYSVPLPDPAPDLIKEASVIITLYKLYQKREIEEMPESVVEAYKDIRRRLEKLSDGTIILDVPDLNTYDSVQTIRTKDSILNLGKY